MVKNNCHFSISSVSKQLILIHHYHLEMVIIDRNQTKNSATNQSYLIGNFVNRSAFSVSVVVLWFAIDSMVLAFFILSMI